MPQKLSRAVQRFDNSVGECPPPTWKVGCSIHRVTRRNVPWAKSVHPNLPGKTTIQASAYRQLPSPTKKRKVSSQTWHLNALPDPLHCNDQTPVCLIKDLFATQGRNRNLLIAFRSLRLQFLEWCLGRSRRRWG